MKNFSSGGCPSVGCAAAFSLMVSAGVKIIIAMWLIVAVNLAYGNSLSLDIADINKPTEARMLTIPYAFYNENTELAVAAAVATSGYLQPQTTSILNTFVSTNTSLNLFLTVLDYQMPFVDRLFLDAQVMVAEWGETESYQNGNPDFPDEVAGSNDSHQDNYIEADGSDRHYRFRARYLFAIGDGRDNPIHTFATRAGLLVEGYEAGGREWNPFTSGRTTLQVEPFYREQDFEDRYDNNYENITSGVKFALAYDNTDWFQNPNYGSRQSLSVARDWGQQDEAATFTAIQFSYSKYIPLTLDAKTRQRVLAFNFWTSDVPTWNSSSTDKETGLETYHRAPLFEGSTLGGIDRQRGFSSNRFHDRSAINYSLEYRHTPVWNPAPSIPLLNKLPIPWWQWVGFVEVGRVADNWSVSDLHSKMKVSAGAGIRMSVAGLVIRLDVAGSEEGGAVQMFFGHSY